jgi:hypothetical protein
MISLLPSQGLFDELITLWRRKSLDEEVEGVLRSGDYEAFHHVFEDIIDLLVFEVLL